MFSFYRNTWIDRGINVRQDIEEIWLVTALHDMHPLPPFIPLPYSVITRSRWEYLTPGLLDQMYNKVNTQGYICLLWVNAALGLKHQPIFIIEHCMFSFFPILVSYLYTCLFPISFNITVNSFWQCLSFTPISVHCLLSLIHNPNAHHCSHFLFHLYSRWSKIKNNE